MHDLVKDNLPDVSERRVPQVVPQSNCLRQVLVQAQHAGHRARQLGNLHRVRDARAVVVAALGEEDLTFVLEASESPRVDDPVAVALERSAVRVLIFRVKTSLVRPSAQGSKRSQGALLETLQLLAVPEDYVREFAAFHCGSKTSFFLCRRSNVTSSRTPRSYR